MNKGTLPMMANAHFIRYPLNTSRQTISYHMLINNRNVISPTLTRCVNTWTRWNIKGHLYTQKLAISQLGTPLCKSNGIFFSDMDINELTSVLHKYKTPVTKCCILTCCWANLVCIRHVIVKIMPEKHAWGPDFLMSDSPYIFQLFEN